MKKLFIILALVALMPLSINAQDARQRTAETIIADGLAQLPAERVATYNNVMSELASTGAAGVEAMAAMLVPAADGQNATVEYALNGVVDYVTAQGKEAACAEVAKGLGAAIDKCTDNANKAFLMNLLQICATVENAPVFVKYINDEYLSDYAVRGLISTPGTEEIILNLVENEAAPKAALAYAVAKKGITAAEPTLLVWTNTADDQTKSAIYYALGQCGTKASLKTLAAAAAKAGYDFEITDATSAYVNLLNTMVKAGDKKTAEGAAKSLLKATKKSNIRSAALDIIVQVNGKNGLSYITTALGDSDRAYRNGALLAAAGIADEQVYTAIVKKMASVSDEAKIDIINFLGANHVEGQIDAVVAKISSDNQAIAAAAIDAAGKIGGQKALGALTSQIGGKNSAAATAALLAFNGDASQGLIAALDGDAAAQSAVLPMVAKRRISAAAPKVYALLESEDAAVKAAAYDALSGVSSPADFDKLSQLLENAPAEYVGKIQAGLKNAVSGLSADEQYAKAAARMASSKNKALYYPVLAQAGSQAAIDELVKGYRSDSKKEALAALLQVNNPAMIDILYGIAVGDASDKDKALARYTQMVKSSETLTGIQKYQLYRKALEAAPSAGVQKSIISALADTRSLHGLLLAAKYLDNKEVASAAAAAVKNIASKNTELNGAAVKNALIKARDVYDQERKDNPSAADAGYAVDEINGKILPRVKDDGYVAVFDGTKDGWSAVVLDPEQRAALKAKKLAKMQAEADAAAAAVWAATEDGIEYTGSARSALAAAKDYENFELYIDYKTDGEAGLGIRSIPQINLGGENSGALAGNVKSADKSLAKADNKAGEWNTLYVKVVNDRVNAEINGVTVIKNAILENACNRDIPAYVKGQIQLIAASPVQFRDLYINELPSTPVFELSAEEAAEGFEVLFDGTSMHKWTGNTTDYVPVDGTIYVTAQYGGGGNLYTVKEFSDFIYRFEFCFVREGVNNGVGIRTPMGVDAAYEGMEIQILDHDAPIYKGLREYQVNGSVYGIIPAKRQVSPELGTWNTYEVQAIGDNIKVTVNGEVIVDGNIREACQGHNVAPDGAGRNEYTVDHRNHPGLFNKSGHIGFLGHGAGVKFRNIRIKDLSADAAEGAKTAKSSKKSK